MKFYDLSSNPAAKAGGMGADERAEMLFWTKKEYLKFADAMMDKPHAYYAFQMLYWCGVREGEMLALTPADFDFTNNTVRINKSYQGSVTMRVGRDGEMRSGRTPKITVTIVTTVTP